ncbi:hypothetical protein [Listeria fleischmannii]|uniref:Uncharacterized protein n=1 Tax=Listeria fleischmannii FSL S10-1203 TaxID=1265822 RepID=W7DQG3_9LIST|nr:hypothetical protein [Listeria fleischmannii]EUJ52274.1 hypothetical protein MCOL2_14398 [Listeria fleischmannii FSL S10-1203]
MKYPGRHKSGKRAMVVYRAGQSQYKVGYGLGATKDLEIAQGLAQLDSFSPLLKKKELGEISCKVGGGGKLINPLTKKELEKVCGQRGINMVIKKPRYGAHLGFGYRSIFFRKA